MEKLQAYPAWDQIQRQFFEHGAAAPVLSGISGLVEEMTLRAFRATLAPRPADGLAMLVQGVLRQDPFSGHLFVFRGRKANLVKIVFWDGTGLCLFTKRLEHGVFLWPSNVDPGGTLMLTSAQLSMLIDGVDWRAPERQWRPAVAG